MEGPAWASTNDYAAPLTSHKAPGILTPIHSHGGQYTVIIIMINVNDIPQVTPGASLRAVRPLPVSPRPPCPG